MTTDIIVALLVAIILFIVLVAIWYFAFVPAKKKALVKEARETGIDTPMIGWIESRIGAGR